MTSTPRQLQAALRRLAEWPVTELPVISAFLDLRPEGGGSNPQVRSGLIVLRDRLRELERQLEPHTPAHDSFMADIERLDAYIENEALPDVQGLALFACHGAGNLFEAVRTAEQLDDEVSSGRHPRLLPLARLAAIEPAIVALVDTNTLRLFALRSGALEEIGLLDDEPDDYTQTSAGGWSQARFQRHIEEHREAFAELAANAVEEVARREDAQLIVLAGDEVGVPLLRDALPQQLLEKIDGEEVLRIEMRAQADEVEEEAVPHLQRLQQARARDAADRLVGAVRADGLAVGGMEQTLSALQLGQAAEVIIDSAGEFGEESLDDLIRLAATTDARSRFVSEHGGLRELGGVGALLRFRLDRAVSEPQAEAEREGASATL